MERYELLVFENGDICSLPFLKVLEPDPALSIHQKCTVRWNNGKKYKAEMLLIGKLQAQR